MRDLFIELITKYGLETVALALIINLLTGVIKLPIKKLATRLKDSSKLTRFIVFLPILLGFGITCLYRYLSQSELLLDRGFFTLFITSTSLSLTFYAIIEKIFPSKKKLQLSAENKASERLIQLIKEIIDSSMDKVNTNVERKESSKLILGGKNDAKIEIKEK